MRSLSLSLEGLLLTGCIYANVNTPLFYRVMGRIRTGEQYAPETRHG